MEALDYGGTANPNKVAKRCRDSTRAARRPCRVLPTLDGVLDGWPALPRGGRLDLVRIKTGGKGESLILAGLGQRLATGAISRLLVFGNRRKNLQAMSKWPWYKLDSTWDGDMEMLFVLSSERR